MLMPWTIRFISTATDFLWWAWDSIPKQLRRRRKPGRCQSHSPKSFPWRTRFPFRRKVTRCSDLRPITRVVAALPLRYSKHFFIHFSHDFSKMLTFQIRMAHGGTRASSRRAEGDVRTAKELPQVQQLSAGHWQSMVEAARVAQSRFQQVKLFIITLKTCRMAEWNKRIFRKLATAVNPIEVTGNLFSLPSLILPLPFPPLGRIIGAVLIVWLSHGAVWHFA